MIDHVKALTAFRPVDPANIDQRFKDALIVVLEELGELHDPVAFGIDRQFAMLDLIALDQIRHGFTGTEMVAKIV